jgi:hypothetical protein
MVLWFLLVGFVLLVAAVFSLLYYWWISVLFGIALMLWVGFWVLCYMISGVYSGSSFIQWLRDDC